MPQDVMTATRTCRLLYYGAGDTGKRENLQLIHRSIPPEQRLHLASGDPERQIAFKLPPGPQGHWQILVQSVDAGRERYRGAGMPAEPPFDGIVFVVHSGASRLDQGLSSLESLKAYLDSYELDLLNVPLVIQYNRRDESETLPVDRLESLLNPWGLLSFPASTRRGEGVREALKAILGLTINHLKDRPEPVPPSRTAAPDGGRRGTMLNGNPTTEDEGLMLDYGPPLPGTEIEKSTRDRSEAIFDELRPPVVVPVRVPRRLLQGDGPVRLLLELTIVDDDRG